MFVLENNNLKSVVFLFIVPIMPDVNPLPL